MISTGANDSREQAGVRGMVFNVMRFSVSDGPGIRTTVFLKGCPLRCPWCQNPESISPAAEVMFREERCIRCGECLDACKNGAVEEQDGRFVISRDVCIKCGECADACSSDARGFVGREMDVEALMAEVRKDVIFYDQSGGGVTFSGGEPLLQPLFLREALKACVRENIRTAVDTTGHAPPEVIREISPYVDLFLYDIKTMDDSRHRRFTGVSNRLILENIKTISSLGKSAILRIPVIPGFNDDEENISSTGRFALSLGGVKEIHLLPYHSAGAGKYPRLGLEYKMSGTPAPGKDQLERLADLLQKLSIQVSIGG